MNVNFFEKLNLDRPITEMWEFIKSNLLHILEKTVQSKMLSSTMDKP